MGKKICFSGNYTILCPLPLTDHIASVVSNIESTQERPWSDLPMELLELISKHLTFHDLVNFCAVSKSWRKAAIKQPHFQALKWPWLILPQESPIQTVGFYNHIESQSHHFICHIYPESICFGSSKGWLMMYHVADGYGLFNPFNDSVRELPFPDFAFSLYEICIIKSILIPVPLNDIVVAIGSKGGLYCARPWDEKWEHLIEGFEGNIVFHQEMLYCVGMGNGIFRSKIFIFSFKSLSGPKHRMTHTILLPDVCHDMYDTYLVESCSGGLLLIKRNYTYFNEVKGFTVTDNFLVFKLDLNINEWVPVQSLLAEVIFLSTIGECYARSIVWPNKLGYRPNRIYFNDLRSGQSLIYHRFYDQGIFSLEDGSFEELLPEDSYSEFFSPFWFFPRSDYSQSRLLEQA